MATILQRNRGSILPGAAMRCLIPSLLIAISLAGCDRSLAPVTAEPRPAAPAKAYKPRIEMVGSGAYATNYSRYYINGYYVYDSEGQLLGKGPNVFERKPDGLPSGGFYSSSCCIRMPKHWQPGLKYRVIWEVSPIESDKELPDEWWPQWYVAEAELAPFEGVGGTFSAMFLDDHRVILIISDGNWPSNRPRHDSLVAPAPDNPYIAQGVLEPVRSAEEARRHTPEETRREKRNQRNRLLVDKIRKEQGDAAAEVARLEYVVETFREFVAASPPEKQKLGQEGLDEWLGELEAAKAKRALELKGQKR